MNLATTIALGRMFARLVWRLPPGHVWYLARQMRDSKPHRFAGRLRVNSFFPPYPSPAFDRFLKAVRRRARLPYSVYLAVTDACPFRCPHCSYGRRRGGVLTREKLLAVIGEVKALGTATLGLTGGEPLLRPDLEDLIAAAGPEMATVLFTTGHGLDAARARRLAEAGVTNVTVGIESSDPAEHDRVRGREGSFGETEAAVAACVAAGVYVALSTVAAREKLRDGSLDDLYRLAQAWGARELRLLPPVATGAWAGRPDVMLTPEERAAVVRFHREHNRQRGGPTVAALPFLESAEMFGCGAGYHHLFIDASGEVCPCDLTPLAFGNVAEEPLAAIWDRLGSRFPRPRLTCLMAEVAGRIPPGPLPLPREASEALCPPCAADGPLPEVHRRLFRIPV